MNSRLIETLKKNNDLILRGGEFIDSYNKIIITDGIAGTITTRVNDSCQTFIVVVRDEERMQDDGVGR